MRAGTALTQLVEFSDGFPDGNINWELLDGQGAEVATGSVPVTAGSVSAVVAVSAAQNVLGAGVLAEPRELSWAYTVGGLVHTGRRRYRLEAFLPLGVSEDGVRNKLGLELHELEDEKIDLIGAYSRFQAMVGQAELAAVEGHAALLACGAIEALAGLMVLPSLQISIAAKESSGTNQFQRTAINWDVVRAQLEQFLAEGTEAANPALDTIAALPPLLVVVVRDDPVTNTTA